MEEPIVSVGILHSSEIHVILHGEYQSIQGIITGEQTLKYQDGNVRWNGQNYDSIVWTPTHSDTAFFTLKDVVIGINFHWERKENQSFKGKLKIQIDEDKLVAINQLLVEEYLTSVISSEMSQYAGLELLKAHAVISRSWLLAQMFHKRHAAASTCIETPEKLIRWYDHDDHTLYDVCADDHCQRYQGITRATNPTVAEAIEATRGCLLMDGEDICDARFSKCCGGTTEIFSSCWEEKDYKYLVTKEDPFCNTSDKHILQQVLNNYDQETIDFYRWKVSYTKKELSELIFKRSGIDYGEIIDLIPIRRGPSGRIIELQIVGAKRTRIIGKELEIRRTLSTSHLFSSAFEIEKKDDGFILYGKGWGHGVGLCQIGAAVMGTKGYSFTQILEFYYPNTQIVKKYN